MTGEISVKRALDRELVSAYTLTVEAADFGFPAPRKVSFSYFVEPPLGSAGGLDDLLDMFEREMKFHFLIGSRV